MLLHFKFGPDSLQSILFESKIVYLKLLISILLINCSPSKQPNSKIKYFDVKNVEISKSKFNKIRATNTVLDIPGNMPNQRKLFAREEKGHISNKTDLLSQLELATHIKLSLERPIVIIYYPGKDDFNSSGTTDKVWIRTWFEELESGLLRMANVKPIYIYKDNTGLEKYDNIIDWNKDPNNLIEHLFFKYHYPSMSFVVLSKDGDYYSYFGEFSKEQVWEACKVMNR